MIKCISLHNINIITFIEELTSELGEPDCKLTNPFVIKNPQIDGLDLVLEPWLGDITDQNSFMISSDKIITISDPRKELLEKYQSLIK
jgi:hypothetical protein